MGFITGNTNTFEVYLTDKGREAFVKNDTPNALAGLNNVIKYFSISDESVNYNFFNKDVNTGSTFNPKTIENQDIPYIKLSDKFINGEHNIFTQLNKRGGIKDNFKYRNPLLSIKDNMLKDVMVYQPDLDSVTDKIDYSFRKLNDSRHFNLSGLNGVYLKSYNNITVTGTTDLLKNYDFYPIDNYGLSKFRTKNSAFSGSTRTIMIGSNIKSRQTINENLSEIKKLNELVLNEKYHVEFKFYFRYFGGLNNVFEWDNADADGNLLVSLYVKLGTNKLQLDLTNLQQYSGSTWGDNILSAPYVEGVGSTVYQPLVQLTGNTMLLHYVEKTDTVTEVGYPPDSGHDYSVSYGSTENHFDDYLQSPTGFNFRVDASLDISQFSNNPSVYNNLCKKNKDISIIVEYNKMSDAQSQFTDVYQSVTGVTTYTYNSNDEISVIDLG